MATSRSLLIIVGAMALLATNSGNDRTQPCGVVLAGASDVPTASPPTKDGGGIAVPETREERIARMKRLLEESRRNRAAKAGHDNGKGSASPSPSEGKVEFAVTYDKHRVPDKFADADEDDTTAHPAEHVVPSGDDDSASAPAHPPSAESASGDTREASKTQTAADPPTSAHPHNSDTKKKDDSDKLVHLISKRDYRRAEVQQLMEALAQVEEEAVLSDGHSTTPLGWGDDAGWADNAVAYLSTMWEGLMSATTVPTTTPQQEAGSSAHRAYYTTTLALATDDEGTKAGAKASPNRGWYNSWWRGGSSTAQPLKVPHPTASIADVTIAADALWRTEEGEEKAVSEHSSGRSSPTQIDLPLIVKVYQTVWLLPGRLLAAMGGVRGRTTGAPPPSMGDIIGDQWGVDGDYGSEVPHQYVRMVRSTTVFTPSAVTPQPLNVVSPSGGSRGDDSRLQRPPNPQQVPKRSPLIPVNVVDHTLLNTLHAVATPIAAISFLHLVWLILTPAAILLWVYATLIYGAAGSTRALLMPAVNVARTLLKRADAYRKWEEKELYGDSDDDSGDEKSGGASADTSAATSPTSPPTATGGATFAATVKQLNNSERSTTTADSNTTPLTTARVLGDTSPMSPFDAEAATTNTTFPAGGAPATTRRKSVSNPLLSDGEGDENGASLAVSNQQRGNVSASTEQGFALTPHNRAPIQSPPPTSAKPSSPPRPASIADLEAVTATLLSYEDDAIAHRFARCQLLLCVLSLGYFVFYTAFSTVAAVEGSYTHWLASFVLGETIVNAVIIGGVVAISMRTAVVLAQGVNDSFASLLHHDGYDDNEDTPSPKRRGGSNSPSRRSSNRVSPSRSPTAVRRRIGASSVSPHRRSPPPQPIAPLLQ